MWIASFHSIKVLTSRFRYLEGKTKKTCKYGRKIKNLNMLILQQLRSRKQLFIDSLCLNRNGKITMIKPENLTFVLEPV